MGRFFQEHREHLLVSLAVLVLVVAGFWTAYQFVEPAPPSQLKMATGSPAGAYSSFGQKYSAVLGQQKIRLDLQTTSGSVQNLQLLRSGAVDIAFVQGGIGLENREGLLSLGSLYYEPLWVFYRKGIQPSQLADLTALRFGVGPEGSGTRAIALELLSDNGVTPINTTLQPLGGKEAATALLEGRLDVAFLVAGTDSEAVQTLLKSPEVTLFSFDRADAYVKHHHYLSRVVLPQGAVDLQQNIPHRETVLLAPAATLVVREDFHPALIGLILQAATRIHRPGGLLEDPGVFPNGKAATFPLSEDAARYYAKGPSFLQRYLPFWAANLIDRMIVMLVPLITLLIPMFKVVPPTYRWRVRRKIYRWYDQLRELDLESEAFESPEASMDLLARLQEVEHDVMQVAVPKSYMDAQYNLRLHIRLIRERLERQKALVDASEKP